MFFLTLKPRAEASASLGHHADANWNLDKHTRALSSCMALLSPLCPTVLTQHVHTHAQLHTGSHVCTHTLETRYKGVNSDTEGRAAMAVSHHHLGPPVTGG